MATVNYDGVLPGDAWQPRPVTKTTIALVAGAAARLQAIGVARWLEFSAVGADTVYVRFSDGMSALSVGASDHNVVLTATTTAGLPVPPGYGYIEFVRSGGSDFAFSLALQS